MPASKKKIFYTSLANLLFHNRYLKKKMVFETENVSSEVSAASENNGNGNFFFVSTYNSSKLRRSLLVETFFSLNYKLQFAFTNN